MAIGGTNAGPGTQIRATVGEGAAGEAVNAVKLGGMGGHSGDLLLPCRGL